MRILGIDPSLCNTGWGMIDITEDIMTHIAHGVIKTPIKLSTEKRLSFLSSHCKDLIVEHAPDIACIEETFCGLNPVTNLRLGFASGAILCTFGIGDVPVFRYPTRLVKFLVTTNGGSSKSEVRDRVLEILSMQSINNLDSSDALAVAVAHVLQERRTPEEIAVKRPKRKSKKLLVLAEPEKIVEEKIIIIAIPTKKPRKVKVGT